MSSFPQRAEVLGTCLPEGPEGPSTESDPSFSWLWGVSKDRPKEIRLKPRLWRELDLGSDTGHAIYQLHGLGESLDFSVPQFPCP